MNESLQDPLLERGFVILSRVSPSIFLVTARRNLGGVEGLLFLQAVALRSVRPSNKPLFASSFTKGKVYFFYLKIGSLQSAHLGLFLRNELRDKRANGRRDLDGEIVSILQPVLRLLAHTNASRRTSNDDSTWLKRRAL